ncbi:MAG: hypothetical protein ACRDN0_03855, partial [Trebonia sp.]
MRRARDNDAGTFFTDIQSGRPQFVTPRADKRPHRRRRHELRVKMPGRGRRDPGGQGIHQERAQLARWP